MEDAYAAAQQRVHQLQHHPEAWGYAGCTVECIETHISWLLLVGEHVYKFKKPLALDFLDFSTAALRSAACQEELRINRRTAPHMYLDVVGVVGDGSDSRPWRVKPWAAGDAAGVEPARCKRNPVPGARTFSGRDHGVLSTVIKQYSYRFLWVIGALIARYGLHLVQADAALVFHPDDAAREVING